MYGLVVGLSNLAANWLPGMTKQPSVASQLEVASCSSLLWTDAFGYCYYYYLFYTGSFLFLANSSKNAFSSVLYIFGYIIYLVLYYMLWFIYPSI
jgi:hypothetical protein